MGLRAPFFDETEISEMTKQKSANFFSQMEIL